MQSFLVLLASSLLVPSLIVPPLFVLFLTSLLLWWILLGLQEFLFVDRFFWHYCFFVVLAYSIIFWYVLLLDAGGGFLGSSAILFVLFALLLNEFFALYIPSLQPRARATIIATGILLLLQGIWVLRLLPLSPHSVVAIALAAFALFAELMVRFYTAEFFATLFVRRLVLFIGFALLIFLTSRWSL